jgi:branched-subunit amino acid transport protein
MTAWLVITAIGAGSYAMRAVMLALVGVKPLPARVDTAMRHVGPAAIAAGFTTVRRTGNVVHAITVGLPTLWLITAVTH